MSDAPVRKEKKIVSRSIRLDETLDELIVRQAGQEDRSFSDVLRKIVEVYFFGHSKSLFRAADRRNGNDVAQGHTEIDSRFVRDHTDFGGLE